MKQSIQARFRHRSGLRVGVERQGYLAQTNKVPWRLREGSAARDSFIKEET